MKVGVYFVISATMELPDMPSKVVRNKEMDQIKEIQCAGIIKYDNHIKW
jgi:hypothetical protein